MSYRYISFPWSKWNNTIFGLKMGEKWSRKISPCTKPFIKVEIFAQTFKFSNKVCTNAEKFHHQVSDHSK